jgi:glutamate N-acetyltransferase/amino-acid N-acetyltransferase
MNVIKGGVTAPEGFFATGVACGLKKDGKKDLAIVCSEDSAAVAGVFTTNKVKGHSLLLTMEHIKSGYANAIIINSGNANACVGEQGYEDALAIAAAASEMLDCRPQDILVASTGVIGERLDMDAILPALEDLVSNMDPDGGQDAAKAIMTTDTVPKEIAIELELQDTRVVIGGMAKGSGMIHPNMATLIGVITTDTNISRKLLDKALKTVVKSTFNKVTIDGDTSVCDMVVIFANGMAENPGIINEGEDYEIFVKGLEYVCTWLAKMIARDGEGATKLVEVVVEGAENPEDAHKAASAVAKSPLVKTMLFGNDVNWGRIMTAVGYSGAEFDTAYVDIYIGDILVCKAGCAVDYDEAEARKLLEKDEVRLLIKLNKGVYSDRVWTCDLSYDYVKINASYRS